MPYLLCITYVRSYLWWRCIFYLMTICIRGKFWLSRFPGKRWNNINLSLFQNHQDILSISLSIKESFFVKKLPTIVDQFGLQSVEYYYKIKYNKNNLRQNKFTFQTVQSSAMWKFWKDIEVNKAAITEKRIGRFLKKIKQKC